MALGPIDTKPRRDSYDVVIVGGAIMGSSTAWHLSNDPDFDGSVLVIERDPSYRFASTTHTNSCIRQQFSTELNIRISRYGAGFIRNARALMGDDPRVPEIKLDAFGYLYLADTERFAATLRMNAELQRGLGAETEILTADEIAARYPFYNTEGIVAGSINRRDEGYFDGATLFDWWKRQARERGVEYVTAEVVAMDVSSDRARVQSVVLGSGERIACGQVVNASGPRAALTARMAGIDIPIEPRKRYTWVFKAETPLDQPLPLTIDPAGVHVRENGGGTYLCGGHATHDPAADFTDFDMDQNLWMNHIWPTIATRIPAFESVRVQSEWTGHYAMNTFDQNAVTGPHPEIGNFVFQNGFSGHGLQQSPAMGRGTAEWLVHGAYRTLDLTEFHFDRILNETPIVERAII